MPITNEYRLFFFNREIIGSFKYWNDGIYNSEDIDLSIFRNLAKDIKSNFFTMDIAKENKGKWYIVELGDGQVAGLPDDNNAYEFYKNINLILR